MENGPRGQWVQEAMTSQMPLQEALEKYPFRWCADISMFYCQYCIMHRSFVEGGFVSGMAIYI